MSARPFTPEMGRQHRRVHGGWQAAAGCVGLLVAAVAGQHGLGGVVAVVLLVVILVALVVACSRFAGWAVRGIRCEVARQRQPDEARA